MFTHFDFGFVKHTTNIFGMITTTTNEYKQNKNVGWKVLTNTDALNAVTNEPFTNTQNQSAK